MIKYLYKSNHSLNLPLSLHPLTTHAIVAEANPFTEKMKAKMNVGQMDLYDGHFKST